VTPAAAITSEIDHLDQLGAQAREIHSLAFRLLPAVVGGSRHLQRPAHIGDGWPG
jgi:hypothetical protein